MRPSPQGCWRPFAAIVYWRKKNAVLSTSSTNTSVMIWMRSCGLSVSELPLERRQREQNSRCGPYNGN